MSRFRAVGRLTVVGLTLLVSTACVSGDVPAAPADDAQLQQGRDVYAANCVSCHRADGSGGIGSKLDEGRVVERFPNAADEVEVVADGRAAMPGFASKLSDAEIEAVVAYTRQVLAGASE